MMKILLIIYNSTKMDLTLWMANRNVFYHIIISTTKSTWSSTASIYSSIVFNYFILSFLFFFLYYYLYYTFTKLWFVSAEVKNVSFTTLIDWGDTDATLIKCGNTDATLINYGDTDATLIECGDTDAPLMDYGDTDATLIDYADIEQIKYYSISSYLPQGLIICIFSSKYSSWFNIMLIAQTQRIVPWISAVR